jgi:leucyl aminopeptidase
VTVARGGEDDDRVIEVRRGRAAGATAAFVVCVLAAEKGLAVVEPETVSDPELRAELAAFIADVEHTGAAGMVQVLARPTRRPLAVLVVGVGTGDEADWRAAGAAMTQAARCRWSALHVDLPEAVDLAGVRGLAEGAALGSYRFQLPGGKDGGTKLRTLTLTSTRPAVEVDAVLAHAAAVSEAIGLARDLTNTPSSIKSPKWFADRVVAAAQRRPNLTVKVFDRAELEREGFGGILAVAAGSPRPPAMLELAWRPRGSAKAPHVVVVGKGITFDTGGISIKPPEPMLLMRKDMAGAASACAAVLAAADLRLPVRVTVLAPLAENMISGSAWRPGDVVHHYGGMTTEIRSTDSEGRIVVADALAYAVRHLSPDLVLDLATLTAAGRIALGRRTGALYAQTDEMAAALMAAGEAAGEPLWRMPMPDEYFSAVTGEHADLNNTPEGGAGSVVAALFLREFLGGRRDRWAHIDMSAPSWSDNPDNLLGHGATGFGVRTVVRWLSAIASA